MSHYKPLFAITIAFVATLFCMPVLAQEQPTTRTPRKTVSKPVPTTPPAATTPAPTPAATPEPQPDYLLGRKIGTWYLQKRFYMVDANGDELLDKAEFEYFADEFAYYLDAKNFRVADHNNDLHISPNELRAALDDELIHRRVQEKIEISDLTRRYPELASPTVANVQANPEVAGMLLGNMLWMTEHSDIVTALLADKSWLSKSDKALFTINKNLTWLASNPRKAEELYKNPKVKKLLTRLEPWRKAHLEFIRDNALEIRDITYAMQLFDREKVELDNYDFSPLDSTRSNAALDSLSARLRKAREENATLTADLALIREQSKQEQNKLQDRISYLEKQISAVQSDMARTELERNKLTDQIMLQSEAMRKLAVEKERQRVTIADQGQQIAALSTSRDTLSSALAGVRIENTALKGKIVTQNTRIDTLQRQVNTVVAERNQANAQVQSLTLNLRSANTRIDSMTVAFSQVDAERRAALEQATGLELALKGAEEALQSNSAAQSQAQGRIDERLAESVRQRDQLAKASAARDSLAREIQRLEIQNRDLAERESRARIAATANVAVGPQPAAVASMPTPTAGPTFAEYETQRKRAEQLERERAALEEQLDSNVGLIQALGSEKDRLERAVSELQAQTRAFDRANDSLNRLLSSTAVRDLPARMANQQRTVDSLSAVLKQSQTEVVRLTTSNRALQEQSQRKAEGDAALEQKRGEILAREQQIEQRMTILTQKEAQIKAQEARLTALEAKERELKQLEQRLKQQEEALKKQAAATPATPAPAASTTTTAAATPAKPTPAPATATTTPAPSATPAKPATTTTTPATTPTAAPRDANGAALNAPAAAQLRIAIPTTEDLSKIQTYFSQKNLSGEVNGNRIIFQNIKLIEIGDGTYTVQATLQPGASPTEKTLNIVVQAANGDFITEEKYPVEALKAKILFKRIYR